MTDRQCVEIYVPKSAKSLAIIVLICRRSPDARSIKVDEKESSIESCSISAKKKSYKKALFDFIII